MTQTKQEYGSVVARILSLLEVSPMTAAELCEELGGYPRTCMASILRGMRNPTKTIPKRIRIVAYVDDHQGQRRYPRAVYSIGSDPDKPKKFVSLKQRHAAAKRRYNQKRKSIQTTNSVFNLALVLRPQRN